MDTDALRWFQQVADGVTVTEVSELEQTTQSGVSRALARLERDVGTPLLQRSGRTLRMTHAGTVFKRHVDAMLHQLDDGLAAVQQLVDPETGRVAVTFQVSLGTWLVPDLVRSFRAEHPLVQFELRQTRDEQQSSALARVGTDLEITTVRPVGTAVTWRRIAREPLRLAVPRQHRLAATPRLHLTEAASEPFVALRPTTLLRQLADELCGRAGFSPAIVFEGDDLPTVRGFVAGGLGVAIVPALHAGSPDLVGGPLVDLEIDDPQAYRDIGVAWSTERRLLPPAELFRRHVLRRADAGLLPPPAGSAGPPA